MKNIKRISRWISFETVYVTEHSRLFPYADHSECYNGKYPVTVFRYQNRRIPLERFLARYGMCGFDPECKEYPAFITGYDGDDYSNHPMLMELSEYGDKCRLYI